ncbi:MAG TPA: kelch repeat-containing protein [Usitatibacter sp.]|nr:kelch repeat-containing protein [Usitatibacter sp.]
MKALLGFASAMCTWGLLVQAVAASGAGSWPVRAGADDSDPQDCSKNHFILDDPCWPEAGPLHVARAGHTATLLRDGRVLVAGGDGGGMGTSVETYDPATGRWTMAAPLHLSRSGHTATLLADGRVLVLGGHFTYAPSAAVFVIAPTGEIYDPAIDSWELVAGPLTPRIAFTATLLPDGEVLVAGGVDAGDDTVAPCELYDPATGRWMTTGSFIMRWGHTSTALADGRVLVTGGYGDDMLMLPLPDAQVYDPAAGRWTYAGMMNIARGQHAASLLADGRVMVTGGLWRDCCGMVGSQGGYFRAGTLAASEIYDPSTNAWSPGPELGTAREMHTATVLRDGSLLVAGGTQETGQIPHLGAILLDSVESSPAPAMPWVSAASLGTARYNHTATRLADGSVLLVGGLSQLNRSPLSSVEIIYRPPPVLAP